MGVAFGEAGAPPISAEASGEVAAAAGTREKRFFVIEHKAYQPYETRPGKQLQYHWMEYTVGNNQRARRQLPGVQQMEEDEPAAPDGTIIYKTKYNEYFKENIKLFKVTERSEGMPVVQAILSQSSPSRILLPKHKHLIRYYGLYSSRSKGKANKDGSLARFTYRPETSGDVQLVGSPDEYPETVSSRASRRSWARLIQKVYEVDPLICPKCGSEMKVIAIITNLQEVDKILECLKRNNAPPFDKVEIKAS